jgi:hypothetical protein
MKNKYTEMNHKGNQSGARIWEWKTASELQKDKSTVKEQLKRD